MMPYDVSNGGNLLVRDTWEVSPRIYCQDPIFTT